jgi:hypothetical protein
MGNICQLRGRSGPVADLVIRLGTDEITLGRDLANDMVIADTEVSRIHVRLSWTGDTHAVQDLRSTNGTFINGRPVSGTAMLRVGELLTLGKISVFVYELVPEVELDTTQEEAGDIGSSTIAMLITPDAAEEARDLLRARRQQVEKLSPAAAPAQPLAAVSAEEPAPFFEKYLAAIRAGDLVGLLSLYHPDATVLSMAGCAAGTASIREFLRGRMERFRTLAPQGATAIDVTGAYVAEADALVCEWLLETASGAHVTQDGFALRDGKVTRHFAFEASPARPSRQGLR